MAKHELTILDGATEVFRTPLPSAPDSLLMTIPRQVSQEIDDAYRAHFGIVGGALGFSTAERVLVSPEPSVFDSTRAVNVVVYRTGPDGVGRADGNVYRVTHVCRSDYR